MRRAATAEQKGSERLAVIETKGIKTLAKKTSKAKRASRARKRTLVIVESPTKAKTIEKYLGRKFIVRASMGHLRDLPKSQFGIDVDHNFMPKYINIRGKGDLIKALKKDAKNAEKIYLASDPDREGEAIAWHLAHIFDVDPKSDCRIVFNEITKPAIQEAVKHPRAIDMDQVDAQQARRMLDRIVGYRLSPLLWRKVRKGLSAGRVQSVAVRLICEREKEIEAFRSVEYWTVKTKLRQGKRPMFSAELLLVDGKKLAIDVSEKNFNLPDKTSAEALAAELGKASFSVRQVKRSERRKNPSAPFTTSSLQQDAARKLGFISRRTMMLAQQLYEGIDLGKRGATGLITYMRTDSTRISTLAQEEAKTFIEDQYGAAYVPEKPRIYAVGKKAQDAHEGIRPTNIALTPEVLADHLDRDQLKLYTLIWQRFTASQMTAAVYDTLVLTIGAGRFTLRAAGSKLKFAGFTAVYAGADVTKKEKDIVLPELAKGDVLTLEKVFPEQHFTEPPPRYNDASIVKTLEEKDIGRPSTYAPIIETIQARGYVQRIDKHFQPTELGFIVVDMLEEYFKDIVDVKFTATMENELDAIADGKVEKNELLRAFYNPFEQTIEKADKAIGQVEIPVEVSDVKCERCGRMMVVKQGRFGKFLACPGFPECRNTKPLLKKTGVKCPKCGGEIVERKSSRGRAFYGCENYPDCDYTTWDAPQKETCPKCGAFMLRHRYKNGRSLDYCSNDACETRIDHPINQEIQKLKKRLDAKQTKAKAEKAKREQKDQG